MRIDVWSDLVCPWCYIGKRRLEQALTALPRSGTVEIVHRSFQLNPSAPKSATMRRRDDVMLLDRAAGPTGTDADWIQPVPFSEDQLAQVFGDLYACATPHARARGACPFLTANCGLGFLLLEADAVGSHGDASDD